MDLYIFTRTKLSIGTSKVFLVLPDSAEAMRIMLLAANILITDTGDLKYCDFGVSGLLISNNRRNSFVGTP